MYCRRRGTANDDNAYRCVNCSELLHEAARPTPAATSPVNNNLILAIVVTVLCCLPLGLVGVVYAAQVNARAQGGDIAGAEDAARKARLWSFWGLGVGLALYTGYVVLAVLGALGGMLGR